MKKFDIKIIFVLLIDISLVYYSLLISSLIINNFIINESEIVTIIYSLFWIIPIYLSSFNLLKIYNSIWEYASIEEALNVFNSVIISFVFITLIKLLFKVRLEINIFILSNLILLILLIGVRYSIRLLNILNSYKNQKYDYIRTLIIGAGSGGSLLIKEIKNNVKISNKVICLVDDDVNKVGKVIYGVKVVGTTNDLLYIVNKYKIDEIIISIPSIDKVDLNKILKKCLVLKKKIKVFPPFYELIDKSFSFNKIRDVQIEDLLGREEVVINTKGLREFICGEIVLVTGGGGSIGSELCRQILRYNPKKLIIFDIYENNAYDIQNELNNANIEIVVSIGSVQDEVRVDEIFNEYKPTLVFHAAAHKHVPLMESSPKEAIKNNVFGTYNVTKASHKYMVKKFVLISSDKAVNPTNIMGATKRLCEKIIGAFDKISETQFVAVRFGNVLGSNGSVIPLFKKQIASGGPVTVTNKDIIRYFMTVSEAVSLVLQAGAFALGGEIFVLDMGEPIRILDLAEKLIRYSGYEPYKEIDIKITGLRPGEKLYEELLMDEEGLIKTENKKIFVLKQIDSDINEIEEKLEELKYIITVRNIDVQKEFNKFVPTYRKGALI